MEHIKDLEKELRALEMLEKQELEEGKLDYLKLSIDDIPESYYKFVVFIFGMLLMNELVGITLSITDIGLGGSADFDAEA